MADLPAEGEWKRAGDELEKELSITLPENISFEALLQAVTDRIRPLIGESSGRLVSLLYRLDISEKKVRALLEKEHGDSAETLARLIVDRQMEKIKTRRLFRKDDPITDEDRW